jgi:hypothetical protein
MIGREVFGVATAILVVAALSVAIVNGGQTAQVLNAAGSSFSGLIKAATLQS